MGKYTGDCAKGMVEPGLEGEVGSLSPSGRIAVRFGQGVDFMKPEDIEKVHEAPPASHAASAIETKPSKLEWILENYASFGTKLEFVTNQSQEGSQFCKGFGGIGGILRYRLELEFDEEPEDGAIDS